MEEKKELTITIDGQTPDQWLEQNEGRTAIILTSVPDGDTSNHAYGMIMGNPIKIIGLLCNLLDTSAEFRNYIKVALETRLMMSLKNEE